MVYIPLYSYSAIHDISCTHYTCIIGIIILLIIHDKYFLFIIICYYNTIRDY